MTAFYLVSSPLCNGSRIMAILLNELILPISEVALRRVCACSMRSRLVIAILFAVNITIQENSLFLTTFYLVSFPLCNGSRITAILLNELILPISGVALRRVCACSLRSRLVIAILFVVNIKIKSQYLPQATSLRCFIDHLVGSTSG